VLVISTPSPFDCSSTEFTYINIIYTSEAEDETQLSIMFLWWDWVLWYFFWFRIGPIADFVVFILIERVELMACMAIF